MLAYNRLHPRVEVRLKVLIGLHPVGAHERLNTWIRIPLLPVNLVTANMEKLIRKKFAHLPDEGVEKLIGSLLGWIHCRIEDAPLAFNLIGSGSAGQLRIANKPGHAVPGHVELWNYANSAVPRVSDQVAYFILRVKQAIRAKLLQLGKFLALDAKALIVRKMPMKYVELHRRHAVEIAF